VKLCFVASAASIHSYRWVKYFACHGYDVDWISFAPPAFPPIPYVRFHALGAGRVDRRRPDRVLVGALATRRLIRRLEPDLVHGHSVGASGVVAALAGARPLVVTAWGSDVLLARGLVRVAARMVLRRAALVTCDARHMERAIAALGVDPSRIAIVYFGTDTHRFRPAPKDEALVRRLDVHGMPVVVSVRALRPLYDVASLVKAIPWVLKEVPNATFLVAGEGPEASGLRELAASLGVARRTRFVGAIPNDQLANWLNLADVYVSTALSDAGLAASTAEAMACELAVVVTDSGENRLWVADGVNGFVVPCHDPRALGERIAVLLRDPEMRRRFGAINRRVIAERSNFDVEMAKMAGYYADVAR